MGTSNLVGLLLSPPPSSLPPGPLCSRVGSDLGPLTTDTCSGSSFYNATLSRSNSV